jgi:hypothetical protein
MAEACANCGEIVAGAYCPACGQKRINDQDRRLGHLLGQAFAVVTDLDGRFLRSLRALAFQPGRLSRDYLDGRRRHWMSPMALFLLANVLYFVLPYGVTDFNLPLHNQVQGQPHSAFTSGWVERRVLARDAARRENWATQPSGARPAQAPAYGMADYAQAYDSRAGDVGKALIAVHIPFLALGLWAVFRRRRRYFAEHLVVATHLFTFMLLFVQLVLLPGGWLYAVLGFPTGGGLPPAVSVATAGVLGLYTALTLRRSYDAPWWLALLLPIPLLLLMMTGSVYVYRGLQFLVTFAIT